MLTSTYAVRLAAGEGKGADPSGACLFPAGQPRQGKSPEVKIYRFLFTPRATTFYTRRDQPQGGFLLQETPYPGDRRAPLPTAGNQKFLKERRETVDHGHLVRRDSLQDLMGH